jgi:hypothetical protein
MAFQTQPEPDAQPGTSFAPNPALRIAVVHEESTEMKDGFRSKRRLLLGVGLAAATGAISVRAVAQSKVSKANAKYQDKPNGDQRCDGCVQFAAPDGCKVVEGRISPSGWCMLYAPKPK